VTAASEADRAGYHHGDLRNALLEAALELVSSKGVEGFSLREAARAVGVSPAAAYRHFEDKAALLSMLGAEGLVQLARSMERAIEGVPKSRRRASNAAAELAAMGDAYVEFAVRNPSHFRVMFGPWCCNPALEAREAASNQQRETRTPRQILVGTLDALVAAEAITPAARVGAEVVVWAAVHGLASILVEGSLRLTTRERHDAVVRMSRTLLAGLGYSGDTAK